MLTKNGISPSLSTTWIAISLAVFVLVYAVIATVDLLLMIKYSRQPLPPQRTGAEADTPVPTVQY